MPTGVLEAAIHRAHTYARISALCHYLRIHEPLLCALHLTSKRVIRQASHQARKPVDTVPRMMKMHNVVKLCVFRTYCPASKAALLARIHGKRTAPRPRCARPHVGIASCDLSASACEKHHPSGWRSIPRVAQVYLAVQSHALSVLIVTVGPVGLLRPPP